MKNICFILIFLCAGIVKSQYNEQLYKKAFSYVYENPDNAEKLVLKMLRDEKDTDHMIKLYQLLSRVYMSKRDFDKSLDCILKMKELSKSITDPKQKIKILNSVALQYQNMGLYSKTLESLDEYYKICQTLPAGKFKTLYLGLNSAVRGLVYKNQDNNEMALEKFFEALSYINQVGDFENSVANSSVILYNVGYCYFYLKRYNEAEKYFIKSAEVAKSVHAESLEAFAYKGLSENYTVLGQHQQAIQLLKKSVNLSKKVGDLVLSEGIYKGFADNYLALQDWNNYVLYNKLYNETKFSREQNELASLNKSIDVLNEENNRKIEQQNRKLRIISVIITVFASAIFFWFLRRFITYKKRNGILLKKLNQINKITS
jgi:tetratricopeptide (TPR) repeat protein